MVRRWGVLSGEMKEEATAVRRCGRSCGGDVKRGGGDGEKVWEDMVVVRRRKGEWEVVVVVVCVSVCACVSNNNTVVLHIFLCGCKTWTWTEVQIDRLEVTHSNCLNRTVGEKLTDRHRLETICEQCG
eukprot:316755-Chlamydomonas_euryale.AAC.1